MFQDDVEGMLGLRSGRDGSMGSPSFDWWNRLSFSGGSKPPPPPSPRTDQSFLNFMQFWGKIWQICILAPSAGGLGAPFYEESLIRPCHYHSHSSYLKFIRQVLVNDLYLKVFYVAIFFILFSKTSPDVTPDKFLLSEL